MCNRESDQSLKLIFPQVRCCKILIKFIIGLNCLNCFKIANYNIPNHQNNIAKREVLVSPAPLITRYTKFNYLLIFARNVHILFNARAL